MTARILRMMLAPAFVSSLALLQQEASLAGTSHDRVVELELEAQDPSTIEGWGPSRAVEYEIGFEGKLHVWAEADHQLALQVGAGPVAAGDGGSPYLLLSVQAGETLAARVSAKPGSQGTLRLHFVASPESDETRAAVEAGTWALSESSAVLRDSGAEAASHLLAGVIAEMLLCPGAAESHAITDTLAALAEQWVAVGDEAQALGLQRWVLAARQRCLPPDHSILLATQEDLSDSLFATGDLEGALALRKALLDASEQRRDRDDPKLIRARALQARSLWRKGDLGGARALQESVLRALERTASENPTDILSERALLAIILDDLGELQAARVIRESVLEVAERELPADDLELLHARTNLAISLSKMGEHARARALQEAILEAHERSLPVDHPDLSGARQNLAISLAELGDLAGARALEEQVQAAYQRTLPADHPLLLRSQMNLASTMAGMGDSAAARILEESIAQAFERSLPPDHSDLFRIRMNLASRLIQMGDDRAACSLMESALEAFGDRAGDDHILMLQARGNLAAVRWKLGDLEGAHELLTSVLESVRTVLPVDDPFHWETRANLAVIAGERGDLEGARAEQESIVSFYEKTLPLHHPSLIDARSSLASTLVGMGEHELIDDLVMDMLAGMQDRVLEALTLAPRQAGQLVAAEERRLALVLFLGEAAHQKLESQAFELLETMRLVSGEAARFLGRFHEDAELAPLLDQASGIRSELNDLLASTPAGRDDSDDVGEDLARLSRERDRLEREASRLLSERGVLARGVNVDGLVAVLQPDEAAVGYRRIRGRRLDASSGIIKPAEELLIAHVLTPAGELTRVDLGPASELEQLFATWSRTLGRPLAGRDVSLHIPQDAQPDAAAERQAGVALRQSLLDPVLEAAGPGVKRLRLCADDLVHLVPLEALPLKEARVGDHARIVNEVSFARLLDSSPPPQAEDGLLAIGGVDFDAEGSGRAQAGVRSAPIELAVERTSKGLSFRPIPYTEEEAQAIAQLFESTFDAEALSLTGAGATKAALFEGAPGVGFLHVATHGWFASQGVRSPGEPASQADALPFGLEEQVAGLAPMTLCGLALTGANAGRDSLGRVSGILTAEELCTLDLSRCDLAVLSACETNVGIRASGLAIASLQAALHAAGVRTSITSLWRVGDKATRRLMEQFYRNLWIEGQSKAEALWQAKVQMRTEGAAVRDWAGWVITGDPD